jgi:hypothetical protein
VGKADLQLIANEENQDRAECRKNETGGMKSFSRRPVRLVALVQSRLESNKILAKAQNLV